MNRRSLVVVGLAFGLTGSLLAAQTGAQASGTAAGQTSVSADRSGAQAGAQSSATVAGSASHNGKQAGNAAAGGSNSSSATVNRNGAELASGSTINAVLSKPVDAKKNKPGDPVTAKTTDNVKSTASGSSQVVIPKGSRLLGHVTEARRRDKNEQHAAKKEGKASASGQGDSALGIVFDKAILKDGREVPVHAVIQAVGAAQQELVAGAGPAGLADSGSAMGSGGGMVGGGGGGGLLGGGGGGGLLGGAGSTLGSTTSTVTNTTAGLGNTVGGAVDSTTNAAGSLGGATTAAGQLTSSANGVVGLQGLNLTSTASGASQSSSVITSSTRDVHLDSGTQMLLRVTGSAQ